MTQRTDRRMPARGSHRWLAACLIATLAGPAGCTEFRSMPLPRDPEPPGGTIEPRSGEKTLQALERAIRADAAQRWQRRDGSALAVHAEPVTWRDGALGCPSADRMYTQSTVRGWRIVVSDGVRTASYHASAEGRWLLCPPGRIQPAAPETLVR